MKTLIFLTLFIGSDQKPTENNLFELCEQIGDKQDQKEWLLWDIEEGRVDEVAGEQQLIKLNISIDSLFTIYNKITKK